MCRLIGGVDLTPLIAVVLLQVVAFVLVDLRGWAMHLG